MLASNKGGIPGGNGGKHTPPTIANKKQRAKEDEKPVAKKQRVKEVEKPAINPYTGIPVEEEIAYEKGTSTCMLQLN
jgi:hypothetical protein